MADMKKKASLNTFDDFANLVGQLISEEMHSSWDDFVNHVQKIVEEKYNPSISTFQLDSLYFNVLGSLGGGDEQITLESMGGQEGLCNILQEARKRSFHCERMISDSLDRNDLFIHKKGERAARPQERFLQFAKKNDSLVVLGTGGQGFVLYGQLKSLPYEVLEQFHELMTARLDPEDRKGRKTTEQVTQGVRKYGEKASKLHKSILNTWKTVFEKNGYVFDRDRHFGRKVAVKVFPQKTLSSVGGGEKESTFIGWPDPHIMPILAQGTSEKGISIVIMPFIDVANRVNAAQINRMHSIDDVIDILAKLCRALGKIHQEGLVHRDIKPENIFIVRENSLADSSKTVLRPILTDFGLAIVPEYTAYSISNSVKGTPRYLPPEQAIDAKRAQPQSDMYSLALWAYELLAGDTYNPRQENFAALINRLWSMARGDIQHKPPALSAVKYNIVRNELERTGFGGLFGRFRKRAFRKKRSAQLDGLEKILARMLITQDATPVLGRFSKHPEYKELFRSKGRIEYVDLKDRQNQGHKETFIKKMVELRYPDMDVLVKDLRKVKKGGIPRTPDYRRQLFTKVPKKGSLHPLIKGAAVITIIASGVLFAAGYWDEVIEFLSNLLK